MNPEEQRANVVRYWWSKAEESLASAQREFAAGSYTFAVNRLYYAAFYESMCCTPGTSTILQEAFRSACCFSPRVYQDQVIGREVGKTLRPLIRGSPGRRLHSPYRLRSRVCDISNRALWRVPPRITSLDIYLILILRDGSMLVILPSSNRRRRSMTALASSCPTTIHKSREQWLSMRRYMYMPQAG